MSSTGCHFNSPRSFQVSIGRELFGYPDGTTYQRVFGRCYVHDGWRFLHGAWLSAARIGSQRVLQRRGVPSWEAGKPHPDSGQVVAGWHFGLFWPNRVFPFTQRLGPASANVGLRPPGHIRTHPFCAECAHHKFLEGMILPRTSWTTAATGHCSNSAQRGVIGSASMQIRVSGKQVQVFPGVKRHGVRLLWPVRRGESTSTGNVDTGQVFPAF